MYFSQLTIKINWNNYGYFDPGELNLTSFSVAMVCNELEVSVIYEEVQFGPDTQNKSAERKNHANLNLKEPEIVLEAQ